MLRMAWLRVSFKAKSRIMAYREITILMFVESRMAPVVAIVGVFVPTVAQRGGGGPRISLLLAIRLGLVAHGILLCGLWVRSRFAGVLPVSRTQPGPLQLTPC